MTNQAPAAKAAPIDTVFAQGAITPYGKFFTENGAGSPQAREECAAPKAEFSKIDFSETSESGA